MGEVRDAIKRGLRVNVTLDSEEEYDRVARRIEDEIQLTSDATYVRELLGTCQFRFVSRLAELPGSKWHRLLRVAYALAGGREECSCSYCLR